MKYQIKILKAFFVICVSFLISCDKDKFCIEGTGTIITESLLVEGFVGVDLATSANLVISHGETQEVKAIGHSNIIGKLKRNLNNGVWKVEMEQGCYERYELTIYITLPLLTEVTLSGSGNITVNDFYNQLGLSLSIPGSGDIDLYSFQGAEYVNIDIKGSGSVQVKKSTTGVVNLGIEIGGSGSFYGFGIETTSCNIDIPGSGTCEVFVENELNVNVSGSGTIYYRGNPSITANTNAAGHLINAN